MKCNLKQYREMGAKMTQDELAEMAGTTRETINRLENGKYSPSLKMAYAIVQAIEDAYGQQVYIEDVWEA